jgi:glycosyltransferase involved in cell wall biosynthesis
MNILIITPKIPYPPDEGGKISQFAAIDYLRKKHSLILVLSTSGSKDDVNIAALKELWPEVKIETIRTWHNLPEEQTFKFFWEHILTKAFKRLKRALKKFLLKKKATVIPVLEIDSPWIGQIAPVKSQSFIEQLSEIVKKTRVDIIQVDLIDFIDLSSVLPKEVKKVFIHHELKFGRLATSFSSTSDISASFRDYILSIVKEQELGFLKNYDAVIVFSESDRNKLAEALPGKKVVVSPFPVLDSSFRPVKIELLKIKKLVFVGGEEHLPNRDAVEWYINEIGAEIKRKHDLILHVVGNWSLETIKRYNGNQLVHFTGYVEDLGSYCENSIMIVPVRTGSGIRAKILYAMAQGVPVISAPVGCEGIEVKDKVDLLIAGTSEEFAVAVHLLIDDMDYTFNMVTRAQKIIKEKYSQQAAGELRIRCLEEVLNNGN